MTGAPSDAQAAPDDTTFYLDEREVDNPHRRRGFHDPQRSRLPRFLIWGCAVLLLLGLVVGLWFDGLTFLKENFWVPLLWLGIAFLIYRFKFRQRPYFRIEADALALRSKSYRAERRVDWDELAHIELEPTAIVLRRTDGAPVHLYFSNLPTERVQALKEKLSEAAERRDVPVS